MIVAKSNRFELISGIFTGQTYNQLPDLHKSQNYNKNISNTQNQSQNFNSMHVQRIIKSVKLSTIYSQYILISIAKALIRIIKH